MKAFYKIQLEESMLKPLRISKLHPWILSKNLSPWMIFSYVDGLYIVLRQIAGNKMWSTLDTFNLWNFIFWNEILEVPRFFICFCKFQNWNLYKNLCLLTNCRFCKTICQPKSVASNVVFTKCIFFFFFKKRRGIKQSFQIVRVSFFSFW